MLWLAGNSSAYPCDKASHDCTRNRAPQLHLIGKAVCIHGTGRVRAAWRPRKQVRADARVEGDFLHQKAYLYDQDIEQCTQAG
jgi:hypothetical protein